MICQSAKAIVAEQYWQVSRSLNQRPDQVVSHRDALEFLDRHGSASWEPLATYCRALRQRFNNVSVYAGQSNGAA